MNVASVIQLDVDSVPDRHPAAKKVIIQSDNASDFPSEEIVPFIFYMNTRLDDENICFENMDMHGGTYSKNTIGYSLFIFQ